MAANSGRADAGRASGANAGACKQRPQKRGAGIVALVARYIGGWVTINLSLWRSRYPGRPRCG